jgi:dTDP-4-dehydrorhamnose reductase
VRVATGAVAATHHRSPPTGQCTSWHRCDLTDGGTAVAAVIRELRPRAVVNAAYVQGGDDLWPVTALAPGEMAAACHELGARFVHVSTDVVFDGTTDRAHVERDEPAPVHDYGRAKAEAERRVGAADPHAVIVRTSLLWGDRDDPGPQVMMTTNPDIAFFDDEYRNPLEVSLLADACLELSTRTDVAGILHVAGADTVDRLEFARRVAPLAGVDPASLRGAHGPVDPSRPRNCPLDSSLARTLLHTSLRGIREATP